ncbi:hypothetical protein Tco_1100125 [Tanacetum coccineum]
MAEPLSPDHVFDFPADDPTLDVEDPNMEVEEDPEEEPAEAIPPVVGSPLESPPITPPPLSESSSNSELLLLLLLTGHSREDIETLYGSVRTLERGMRTYQTENVTTRTGVDRFRRRMDAFDINLAFIEQDATRTSDDALALQEERARDREENRRLKRRVDELEVSNTLAAMDQDRIEREFFSMRVWVSGFMSEVMGRDTIEARPTLGWNLEEINVTWAQLEKKQTRLRTYTKFLKEICSKSVETASQA